MSRRDALRTLQKSAPLSRVRIVLIRWPFVGSLILVIAAAIAFASLDGGQAFAAVTGSLLIAATTWLEANKKNRAGKDDLTGPLRAFHDGKLAEAEKGLVEFLRKPRFEDVATTAIVHLGLIAMRQLRFADAAKMLDAACQLDRRGSLTARARSYLAIAQVGAEDLVAAHATLDGGRIGAPNAAARAQRLVARALVELRSGERELASSALALKRPLLDNVLGGNDAALVEAIDAVTGTSSTRVLVDREARAFVLHLVPQCAPHLADE